MKHLILSVVAFCLIQFHLSAYDYQTVYSHRTALFADSGGAVSSLHIDSVSFNGDSILYPFKSIQKVGTSCFTPYGASWLGEKIIIKSDWNYFLNENNDTIRIKTNAGLNATWTAYSNQEMTAFATVQKVELLTFMGLTDSVKTIAFSIGVLAGAPSKMPSAIATEFDGKTIQISKHYGLLKTFNMLVFPYPNEFDQSYTNRWGQYALIGLTNPTVGIRNLTWLGVNDFQVGDELHMKYSYYVIQAGPATQRRSYTILKYTDRQDFSDSVIYRVDRITRDSSFYGLDLTSSNFSHIVEKAIFNQFSTFDLLPGEAFIDKSNAIGTVAMKNDIPLSKTFSEKINFNQQVNCWGYDPNLVSDVCNYNTSEYLQGLGGPYYKYESGCWVIDRSVEENVLVYYKKGVTTWGTPLVIKQPDYFVKNMFWTEYVTSSFGCSGPSPYVYFVQNDTVINGKTYKQILSRVSGGVQPVYNFIGAIREENGKVFGKFPYNYGVSSTDEVKMYDFNLQAGDSATTNVPYSQLSYAKAIVSSIDTIKLLNGEPRKQFHLTNGDVWIEGIGSLSGFFTPFEPLLTCGISHQLMCFVKTEEELYHNPAVYYSGACGRLSALEAVNDRGMKISLVPNPVSDWVIVRFDRQVSECALELIDINGRLVKLESLNSFQNSVNLSSLNNGLYMYRLTEKGKLLKAGRILKR
jgi:hypothetical protein